MARHWFLGGPADWATAHGADETSVDSQSGTRALFIGDASITFWDAPTGGTQITDLQDAIGSPIAAVTADSDGEFPAVLGPDTTPETWRMYADGSGGAGPRRVVVATDMGDTVNALAETVNDLSDQLTEQAVMIGNSLAVVNYDAVNSEWPTRPAGDARRFAWCGPSAPPIGGDYMVDGFDFYLTTAPA